MLSDYIRGWICETSLARVIKLEVGENEEIMDFCFFFHIFQAEVESRQQIQLCKQS